MSSEREHSSSCSHHSGSEGEETIAKDIVVTKYKMASTITNKVLKEVIERCVPGASVRDNCVYGDRRLEEETSKVFKKDKNMKKGIAVPTCVSINNQVAFFSPLICDPDIVMQNGDLVTIELGCHIDGFPATVAQSIVIGASTENKVQGRKADVILAAHYALELALRLIKPGGDNLTLSNEITKVVAAYDCRPVEEWTSFQINKNELEGEKQIVLHSSNLKTQPDEKYEFELHEVYAIDVAVSTGEGKIHECDLRTTVFRKKDVVYNLKRRSSRGFLHEAEQKFGNMMFNLRNFKDETLAKMGVIECVTHDLVEPYRIQAEKEGEFVARFRTTVLLMSTTQMKITGFPVDIDFYSSEHSISDPDIKSILQKSLSKGALRWKRKKAKSAMQTSQAEASGDAADDEG